MTEEQQREEGYWKNIAEQAFERIIQQNRIIEKLQKEKAHDQEMLKFLEGLAGRR